MIAASLLAGLAALVGLTGDDPPVLVIEGHEIHRSEYQEWLLLARGELYAPGFVRLWRLRRLGTENSLVIEPARCREQALQEVQERITGAFNGVRERWLVELAREGRTPEGYLTQRALAIEGELLLVELERGLGRPSHELLASVNGPFEFHPGALLQTDPGAAVLTIDEVVVTREEYLTWLLAAFGELDARRMAETVRIEREALAHDIRVTAEEVDARTRADLERVLEHDYQGLRELWLQELELTGRTEEQVLREFAFRKRYELMIEKLILQERVVTSDELRRAWEQRYGVDGKTFELRWIRIDAASEDELEAAQREAAELKRRLETGEDFATLAELHSDDAATRARGGRPDEDFRLARLPFPLVEPVRALAAGAVSDPLSHGNSVWLFEVTAVRVTPLEDVRDTLLEELRNRRPTEVELAARRNVLVRDLEVRVLPGMFSAP